MKESKVKEYSGCWNFIGFSVFVLLFAALIMLAPVTNFAFTKTDKQVPEPVVVENNDEK